MSLIENYHRYFAKAIEWVQEQEQLILEKGIPLSEDQKIDAYLIGIKEIEKVRLLEVDVIPQPKDASLQQLGKATGLLSPNVIGLSCRYGIFIKKDYLHDRQLIVHELVHTMQYERLGGIENFLKTYIQECIDVGYPNGALEQEAKNFTLK